MHLKIVRQSWAYRMHLPIRYYRMYRIVLSSVPKPNIRYFLKVPNTETECLFFLFGIRYSVFSVFTEYRIDYRMPGKITEFFILKNVLGRIRPDPSKKDYWSGSVTLNFMLEFIKNKNETWSYVFRWWSDLCAQISSGSGSDPYFQRTKEKKSL